MQVVPRKFFALRAERIGAQGVYFFNFAVLSELFYNGVLSSAGTYYKNVHFESSVNGGPGACR